MKQILLFASAAALALSAVAQPKAAHFNNVRMDAQKPERATVSVANMRSDAKAAKNLSAANVGNRMIRRAEGEVTPGNALSARYFAAPWNALFTGLTPGYYYWPYVVGETKTPISFGLAGNYNYVPFFNMSQNATSYEWSYDYQTLREENPNTVVSNDEQLLVPATFGATFSRPTLTAFNGDDLISFEDPFVTQYLCGPSLAAFGYYPTGVFEDAADTPADQDLWGLTTCPINVRLGNQYWTSEGTVNRLDTEGYNANGCPTFWENTIVKRYAEQAEVSNVRLSQFIATIPAQNQAFLLDRIWGPAIYQASAEVVLTVNVYPMNAEGQIDTKTLLGQGTVTIPASAKPEAAVEYMDIDIFAVNADGDPMDVPAAVTEGAAIFFEGLDNPALQRLSFDFNGGTSHPVDTDIEDYYNLNAYMGFTFDAKVNATGQTVAGSWMCPIGCLDYGDGANGTYWCPTDFSLYYNILFPAALNADGNTKHVVDFAVEGGTTSYDIEMVPGWSLAEFAEAGLVTVEKTADWFDYTLTTNVVGEGEESFNVNNFNITVSANAEAAPRTGAILVKGVGTDFAITVKQAGTDAGINEVAGAVAGAACYDLQGRRINEPAQGLYIKVNNGKATKHIAR